MRLSTDRAVGGGRYLGAAGDAREHRRAARRSTARARVDGGEHESDQLKKLAATRGSTWPTKSVVGAAGTHAVYLIAQSDTALGRAVLHRMMEAGPSESPSVDVATFEDRMRVLSGRKQIYGNAVPRRR